MVAGAEAILSGSDENPTRMLHLERLLPPEELLKLYKLIYVFPCSHQVCKKQNCHFFPLSSFSSTDQTVLQFSSEPRAAIFKRVVASQGYQSHFVPSNNSCQYINLTSLIVKEEFRAGIPKRTMMESYCVCSVVLHCISSSSVEDGLVSAPIKISLYTG